LTILWGDPLRVCDHVTEEKPTHLENDMTTGSTLANDLAIQTTARRRPSLFKATRLAGTTLAITILAIAGFTKNVRAQESVNKEILVAFGVDGDAVAGWIGS